MTVIKNGKKKVYVGDMQYSNARDKLQNMILFQLAKLANMDICYKCGQPIESHEEMTLEHKIPWRKTRSMELLSDVNNLAFSHPQCNINDTRGKYRYIGVYCHEHLPEHYSRWQAKIGINNKDISFGYYKNIEAAALARDFGSMQHHKGKCILNFPQLREKYNELIIDGCGLEYIKENWRKLLDEQKL